MPVSGTRPDAQLPGLRPTSASTKRRSVAGYGGPEFNSEVKRKDVLTLLGSTPRCSKLSQLRRFRNADLPAGNRLRRRPAPPHDHSGSPPTGLWTASQPALGPADAPHIAEFPERLEPAGGRPGSRELPAIDGHFGRTSGRQAVRIVATARQLRRWISRGR